MDIEIKAAKDEVLGGLEYSPYLELELTEGGTATLSTGERHSSNNGATFDRWHGRALCWRNCLSQGSYALADTAAIEHLAERVKPLLGRVHAGHSAPLEGSNDKGRLTGDAQEASDEIERIFETAAWCDEERQVWDASEWISVVGFAQAGRELGLTVNSDDAAFEAACAQLERQARSDRMVLVNLADALGQIKEALKAEMDAAA